MHTTTTPTAHPHSQKDNGLRRPHVIICALFPFLYYFRYLYPSTSLLFIGADFPVLYYSYKAYFVDLLSHGIFPLWSPLEGGGYAFFGNPFAAVLYPLNVLPVACRLLAGSYTYTAHQFFTIVGVSIYAVGMYVWLLRALGSARAALFTAIVASVSWNLSTFLRFPNAVHVMAWIPWVLWAIRGLYARRSGRWVLVTGMAFVFCQVTAGYPYMVVYSFALYAGYALYLAVLTRTRGTWRVATFETGLLLAVPALLALPYLSSISQLMRLTTDRGGGDFQYATVYPMGPLDFLGSLVFPPVSTVEGCFYLGIFSTYLLWIGFRNGMRGRDQMAVVAGIVLLIAMAFGYRSYFFTIGWNLLPIVNQMRVFARATGVLVPILAVVVHQGYVAFSRAIGQPRTQRGSLLRESAWALGIIVAVQVVLYAFREGNDGEYLQHFAPSLPPGAGELDFVGWGLLTAAFVLLALWFRAGRSAGGQNLLLALCLAVVTLDLGSQGRFLWANVGTYNLSGAATRAGREQPVAMAAKRQRPDYYPLVANYFRLGRDPFLPGLTPVGATRVPWDNFYYGSYNRFYFSVAKHDDVMNEILGERKLFLHSSIEYASPSAFIEDAAAERRKSPEPAVTSFNGNTLVAAVEASEPCYLSWIDNNDPGWSATVDGHLVPIENLFGTFKSVRLERAGRHVVSFRYAPKIAWWTWLSTATGFVLLVAFGIRRRGRVRAGTGLRPAGAAA